MTQKDTFSEPFYITNNYVEAPEPPFVTREQEANIRNDFKHRQSCQKAKLKRKKK